MFTTPCNDATVDDTSTHVNDAGNSDMGTGTWVEVVNRKRTKKANSEFAQQIVSSALS